MPGERQIDAMMNEALEYGQRNAETVQLVERHCAHARIEITGGIGLLEQQTGLPIGQRAVRCQHASDEYMAGSNLLPIAVRFYKENCVGCQHHKPVAGPPNLASRVQELDEATEARDAAEEQRRKARLADYETRAHERQLAASGEPYATRELIRKLDLIDAENPDYEAGKRIVETARGAATLFTPRAIDILFDVVAATRSRQLVEALRWLAHHQQANRARVVRLATAILAEDAMTEAANVLVDCRPGLTAANIAGTHQSLVRLAGRLGRFGGHAEPAGLLLAADLDLPAVLKAVEDMLESDRDYTRGLAASAAGRLIEKDPALVPILCRQVATALRHPEAIGDISSNDSSDEAIEETLSIALVIAPEEARDAIEAVAKTLGAEAQTALFAAYDDVLRSRLREGVVPEAGDVVVRACLQRLGRDWGVETAQRASATLELCATYHPYLLVPHVSALVGALLDEVRRPATGYHPLLDPAPKPDVIKMLEAQSDEISRGRRLYDLREALGHVVRAAPAEVGEHVFTLLDAPDLDTEETNELKVLAIQLLGPVGRHPDMTQRALPYLYSALLSSDTERRARAVEAWNEIAHPRDRQLPRELDELLLQLLRDPFVMVHKAMVKALWEGLPVPRHLAFDAASTLLLIADVYVDKQDTEGVSQRALDAARRLARQLGSASHDLLSELVLQKAEKLEPYYLGRLLRHRTDELLARPRYADRLLDVLASDDPNVREDDHMDDLVHVAPEVIADRVDRIEEIVTSDVPEHPWHVHRYIEALQLAGEWTAAARIAKAAEEAMPDTAEHLRVKRQLTAVRAAAQFEVAVQAGDDGAAAGAAAEWTNAIDALEAARSNFDPVSRLKNLPL